MLAVAPWHGARVDVESWVVTLVVLIGIELVLPLGINDWRVRRAPQP